MHYLAHIDLAVGRRVEELAPIRDAENDAVAALVRGGAVTAPFLRGDRPGAVFLMHAADDAEAHRALSALPAVAAGIIKVAEIIPLTLHAAHPAVMKETRQ